MDVTYIPERRLSRKIIFGRLRQYLPAPLVTLLLWLRYKTFRRACGDPKVSSASYSDGSWVERGTTNDQKAIEAWLRGKNLASTTKVLHVGVGNSSLAKQFPEISVDGITIMPEEQAYAESVSHARYHVRLCNKYGEELKELEGPYDYIVDNDIAGYACCKQHFFRTLEIYHNLLRADGALLIGRKGLGYFDTGFPIPFKELRKVAERYSFKLMEDGEVIVLTKVSN